jgi:hypothetical protein
MSSVMLYKFSKRALKKHKEGRLRPTVKDGAKLLKEVLLNEDKILRVVRGKGKVVKHGQQHP